MYDVLKQLLDLVTSLVSGGRLKVDTTGAAGATDVSDRAGRLVGHVTVDAATIAALTDGSQRGQPDVITQSGIASGDNRKTVAAAGTRERVVASSTPCKWVSVQALASNTDKVVVGLSTVVAAAGSARGNILSPGDPPLILPILDLTNLWVDSRVNAEGVTFIYGT